jgi:hypothetical protein
MIFNNFVDAVVQAWELYASTGRSTELDSSFLSLVAVMFYADDGCIASYQPKVAYLMEHIELMGVKGHISGQAHNHRMEGAGLTPQARQRTRYECQARNNGMTTGHLTINLQQVHGSHTTEDGYSDLLLLIGNPLSRHVIPLPYFKSADGPVDGCPGRACNRIIFKYTSSSNLKNP